MHSLGELYEPRNAQQARRKARREALEKLLLQILTYPCPVPAYYQLRCRLPCAYSTPGRQDTSPPPSPLESADTLPRCCFLLLSELKKCSFAASAVSLVVLELFDNSKRYSGGSGPAAEQVYEFIKWFHLYFPCKVCTEVIDGKNIQLLSSGHWQECKTMNHKKALCYRLLAPVISP